MTVRAWPERQYDDVTDDTSTWRDFARCGEVHPETFFPEQGCSPKAAKRICRRCEVRAECLEYALQRGEPCGVWGGLTERERRRLLYDLAA
ncbi:WhiB family redox-sensing transcriptional regulator [Streptosporangium album]|uniref:Transcriptional regulator WhiB n=1 Tax=Streptosporangium album TaxID=47479 RepID=A0A7W7RPY2_9ACTN|nr:WhiB family transcriptional regulator [Streptosporangium album]MBB4936005.1 WhiB family redox-sensing transcriptional regulator [Streptosporangium album]